MGELVDYDKEDRFSKAVSLGYVGLLEKSLGKSGGFPAAGIRLALVIRTYVG